MFRWPGRWGAVARVLGDDIARPGDALHGLDDQRGDQEDHQAADQSEAQAEPGESQSVDRHVEAEPVDQVDPVGGRFEEGHHLEECRLRTLRGVVAQEGEDRDGVQQRGDVQVALECPVHASDSVGQHPGANQVDHETGGTGQVDRPPGPAGQGVAIEVVADQRVDQVEGSHRKGQLGREDQPVVGHLRDEWQSEVGKRTHDDQIAEGLLALVFGDQGEHGDAEVDGEERDEEPVDAEIFGVDDAVDHTERGEIGDRDSAPPDLPGQGDQAPDEEGYDGAHHPLAEILFEGVTLAEIHQGRPGDHEEHRNREIADGLDDIGTHPVGLIAERPESVVDVEEYHGRARYHRQDIDIGLPLSQRPRLTRRHRLRPDSQGGPSDWIAPQRSLAGRGQRIDLVAAYARGQGAKKAPVLEPSKSYPQITAYTGTVETVDVEPSDEWSVSVSYLPDSLDALVDRLTERLVDGGCAGVICDTVSRAQETYRRLQESFGEDVLLLHSRFIATDRAQRAAGVVAELGRSAKNRPHRRIVVGTQVLEQSLDIDFDILISDIAPIDLILQRLGRLYRHDRTRPRALATPELLLRGVEDWHDPQGPRPVRGAASVYGASKLMRAMAVLGGRGTLILPTDVPLLVRDGYDPDLPPPDGWEERWASAEDQAGKRRAGAVGRARAFLLDESWEKTDTRGLVDVDAGDPESASSQGRSQVRDSDEGLEVIALFRDDQGILHTPPISARSRRPEGSRGIPLGCLG